MKKVLNVGGNDRSIALPRHFEGWQHVLLDIDPRGKPDVVCDARELSSLPGAQFDAVYCSHNLEHYHHHEVPRVLAGFLHVLKEEGFAHIRVPDIGEVMSTVVAKAMDIDDVLYQSPAGPITVRDTIYGYGVEIQRSGNDFYAHKTGFTRKSLLAMLTGNGFTQVYLGQGRYEIAAYAFRRKPAEFARSLLRLP